MTEAGDFWNWAITHYARPGVAAACLDLQDTHGQIVPLILWAAWTAAVGYTLDEALAGEAASVAQVWSDEVVGPLRAIRRRLKTPLNAGDTDTRLTLREKIKAVELQSERALMTELERMANASIYKKNDLNHVVIGDLVAAMMRVASGKGTDTLKMAVGKLAEALIKS